MSPSYPHQKTSKDSPKSYQIYNPVQLFPIPFPPLDPGLLPEGAEGTVGLPFEKTDTLKIAYDLLQKPINQFIADRLPDWIITDLAAHWVVETGKEYGVPLVYFSVFSAATRAFVSSAKNLSGVHAIRSCEEFEGEYLEAYKNNSGKLVIPTGVKREISTADGIFQWLDKQKTRSVVFVGFASEFKSFYKKENKNNCRFFVLPKILPDLQPFVQLVPIPFPPLVPDLLPEGAEATVDLPFENTDNLKIAYDLLQTPIKQFIGDRLPDWIITDFVAHWVADIGKEYGVPLVYFSVFSAASRIVYSPAENLYGCNTTDVLPSPESLTSPPDLLTSQSTVAFREHEAVHIHAGFYGVNESGISDAERKAKILSACQVHAIRSCDEFEGEYLEAYKNNCRKLVIPTDKGLVCFLWVPQMEILAHPSVGGSLFHSGWGSIIETLQFGHVLVVLPFIIDQPLNARLLEEKGMAVEVKRLGDGSFSRDDIAKTLRHAMVEEEGEPLRSNARKAATVFGDHKLHQDHYIGQFVNFLKNNTTERSSCS
ncbi:unnamed protein product [Malus baccata var. baccata]